MEYIAEALLNMLKLKKYYLSDTSSYMDVSSKNVWFLYVILTFLLFKF